MSIQILNNGASLKIIRDGVSRLVLKTQIKDVSVSGTKLKIETCGCGSSCLFFPFVEITAPVVADVTALRDAVNVMLNTTIEGGSLTIEGFSTEAKQIEELAKLQEVKDALIAASGNIVNSLEANLEDKASEAGQVQVKAAVEAGNVLLTDLSVALQGLFTTLKTGASTEAKQDAGISELQQIKLGMSSINTNLVDGTDAITSELGLQLSGKSTAAKQDEQTIVLNAIDAALDVINASVLAMQVDLVSGLNGKSTEVKQIDAIAKLIEIKTSLTDLNSSLLAAIITNLDGKSTEAQQIDALTKLQEIKTAVEDVAIFINGQLESVMAGKSTADKQDAQTTELENIKTAINNLRTDVQNSFSNDYSFAAPLRMDTDGTTVYKGFAAAGTTNVEALWAIQRITSTGEGNQTIEWAGGNRNFLNLWADRATLIYS